MLTRAAPCSGDAVQERVSHYERERGQSLYQQSLMMQGMGMASGLGVSQQPQPQQQGMLAPPGQPMMQSQGMLPQQQQQGPSGMLQAPQQGMMVSQPGTGGMMGQQGQGVGMQMQTQMSGQLPGMMQAQQQGQGQGQAMMQGQGQGMLAQMVAPQGIMQPMQQQCVMPGEVWLQEVGHAAALCRCWSHASVVSYRRALQAVLVAVDVFKPDANLSLILELHASDAGLQVRWRGLRRWARCRRSRAWR